MIDQLEAHVRGKKFIKGGSLQFLPVEGNVESEVPQWRHTHRKENREAIGCTWLQLQRQRSFLHVVGEEQFLDHPHPVFVQS